MDKLDRKQEFENFASEGHKIFNYRGLRMMKWTSEKIKFSYQPSLQFSNISQKIMFYCSLRYLKKYKKWLIKREPMPAKPLFLKVTSNAILIKDDPEEICHVIKNVYIELIKWSLKEIEYRRQKYNKYCAGELSYLDIDSTDEELYFSDNERQALFEKKIAVLNRMLPPKRSTTKKAPQKLKGTRLKYRI